MNVGRENGIAIPALFSLFFKYSALSRLSRASCRIPVPPTDAMYMVHMVAQSPWLEQMLEVAFSRRICCSRVARVRTKPRWPFLSAVWPTSRPGMLRTYLSSDANIPSPGPPKDCGMPRLCPSPQAMSAPLASRTLDQAERQGLGEARHAERAFPVGLVACGLQVFDAPEKVGGLHRNGRQIVDSINLGQVRGAVGQNRQLHDGKVRGVEIGPDHSSIKRMDQGRDRHRLSLALCNADSHQKSFGQGRRAVVHGRVGHFHAQQAGCQGLVFEDGLQGSPG